jgi:virginiamycin B lyase
MEEVPMRRTIANVLLAIMFSIPAAQAEEVRYFELVKGDGPHDVAPAPDGSIWYTGQGAGVLGRLDPKTGIVHRIPLGSGSAPHGVIIGPDGAAWVTDGGLNAIIRVDAKTKKLTTWSLPEAKGYANLNTAAFDGQGRVWFTGQSGVYGRLDPKTGEMTVWDAPKGRGPYGITATPGGEIWWVSLAGSYLAKVDLVTGSAKVFEPPTKEQGARRVWSDSKGRLWISEWNTGQVSVFSPSDNTWKSWKLPGASPKVYSVYVDEQDKVWLTDFGANAIVRFDPVTESFERFPSNRPNANVRQMAGREGEVWGAESGTDRLIVIRYGSPG